ETASAIGDGALTVGEAAAIASGVKRQVENRDTAEHPDEELYRAKLDHGLANLKRVKPATSVQTLDRTAHALGLTYNPNRAEKNEEAAFAERGARLQTTSSESSRPPRCRPWTAPPTPWG
ncbi:hypothetical protein IDM40_13780, partial [Nocardiopsis sp. HNM0947]|nr:hypothetical protein [Nocardiopsis coralli]